MVQPPNLFLVMYSNRTSFQPDYVTCHMKYICFRIQHLITTVCMIKCILKECRVHTLVSQFERSFVINFYSGATLLRVRKWLENIVFSKICSYLDALFLYISKNTYKSISVSVFMGPHSYFVPDIYWNICSAHQSSAFVEQ